MKKQRLPTLVAACVLILAVTLTAGAADQAGSRPNHAPPPDKGGAVLGDYHWSPLGGPVTPGGQVLGLAVHPSTPGRLFAAASSPGTSEIGPSTVYRSTDGAASWTPVFQAENQVNCLAANGPHVLAGAFQHSDWEGPAIYASHDGGDTWQEAFSFDSRGVFIDASVDPGNPDVAILGGLHNDENWWEDGVVYGTTDGGVTWSLLLQVSVPDQNAVIMAVLISPHDPNLMLASLRGNGPDDTRVYRSTDGGATWTDVATIGGAHLGSFAADATDPQVIYAGTGMVVHTWGPGQVYRSGDAGLSWELVLPNAGGLVGVEAPSFVYALSGGQVWASWPTIDPQTWSHLTDLWDGAQRLDLDLGVSPAVLYAGVNSSGVLRGTNRGTAWQDASNGITSLATPRDIDVDPLGLDRVFVATEGGKGGWRSSDRGATWTQVMDGGSLAFEIQPNDPTIVFGGAGSCDSATIWRSDDGGLTFGGVYMPPWFQPDCSGGNEQVYALEAAPSNPLVVYAAGEAQPAGQDWQGAVLRSADHGLTWTEWLIGPQGSGFNTLAVSALDDQVAWAGGYDRGGGPQAGVVYRTQDGGASWQQVFFDDENNVRSIVVDYADPNIVYAATDNAYDLYKSTDGGDTWTLIRSNNPPFQQPSGNKLAIDPHDHNRIYLGGWGYIAESPDGGATWTEWDAPINQGTPQTGPQALAVDSGSPVQTLYAGFSGLWAHTRPAPAAGDRYVAKTGDDTMNPCTDPANPCLTVGHALGQAAPDETIRVGGGTYVENLTVEKRVTLEGGYSGPPGWTRDVGAYETVLDGSAGATIPGDWDGDHLLGPTVLHNGTEFEMWYTGMDMYGTLRLGRATGGPVSWTKSPDNPLLDGSEAFVRLEAGLYRMWYSRPGGECIGYAWSNDGLAWNEEPDPMLCAPHGGSWESDGVSDPNIVVDGGGTYWMFYEGMNWSLPQPVQIGCATSPDGLAWTRCAQNPVLSPGDPGTWEDSWVLDPAVLWQAGTYRMWYRGRDNGGVHAIGFATSPDGLAWTKYAGNPVFEGTPGTWDENDVANHAVRYYGGVLHMWYRAQGRIGHATSPGGIVWTKDPNPVLEPGSPGQLGSPVVRYEGAVAGARLDGFTVTGGNGHSGGVQVYGPDVTIAGCNIHHNVAAANSGGGGVAVENPGSSAAIVGCQIFENDAADGGGVMFWNGASGSIAGTTITGNTTRGGPGAGIEVHGGGSVTVQDSVVQGNASAGSGGGINVQDGCTLSLTRVEVRNNTAQGWGGGIDASAASLTLVDVTVNDNQSLDGEGGGLVLWNGTTASMGGGGVGGNRAEHGAGGINVGEGSTLTLNTVVINGNTAAWSTGLRLHRSTVTGDRVWIQGNVSTDQNYAGFQLGDQSSLSLTNALIAVNDGGAGGVWGGDAGGSTLSLTNVTVVDNSRSDGWGGVYVSGDSGAVVRNSILVWNGNADLQCDDPNTCTVEHSDLFHPWPGPGNISTNPRFGDLPGGDYHLAGGSPCIEAADPAYAPDHDFDAEPRPYDGDGDMTPLPDMGVDEYIGPPMPIEPLTDLYVDRSVAVQGSGTPGDPYATVGEAVAAAFAGDTLHVADGTYVENLEIAMSLNVLGGYSGVPDWVRDPATFVTVLDGSANPTIPGDWDGQQVRYPMVIEDGGAYKMWYTGCGLGAACRIGLATSTDGIAWNKHGGNPVLDVGEGGTWDGGGLESPYVVKDGPSSYKMWYSGYNGCAIGLATSSDGITWTKHGGNPVLAPGADGWNNNCVQHPTVLYEGGLYKMWFVATGDDGGGQQPYLAHATSPDGIAWTLDPANPLFARDWEEWFWRPYVLPAPGGYAMWYSVWANGGCISYAASSDGLAWTKHGSPVLSGTAGEWDDGFVADPTLLLAGDHYRLWYDNSNALGGAESPDGLNWAKRPENPLLQPGYAGQGGGPVVYISTPSQGKLAVLPGWLARSIGPAQKQNSVVLDGLTVTSGTYWQGGGVVVDNAQAALQGVLVAGNQALGDGGGVAVTRGSTVQVLASQIVNNTAQAWGGGLAGREGSHVTLENVEVRGNHAVTGEGGGLALFDLGTEGHLTDVQVVENQADGGGGISQTGNPGSLLVMDRVEVARNTARWAAGLRPYHSTVVGDRVWIAGNLATDGSCGAFNADTSEVTLTNSLIAGNSGNAGCAYLGALNLTNVTIADNTSAGGWGGLTVSGAASAAVRNSILFFNGDGDLGCEPGSTCTVEYSDLEHPWTGAGNISVPPRFVNRAAADYHLRNDSPCLEVASSAYAPDHDIDGDVRPFDANNDGVALPDMGADEYFVLRYMHVGNIAIQAILGAGYTDLRARVPTLTAAGQPLAGVLTTAQWTLPNGSKINRQATSGANGMAMFGLRTTQHGVHTLCVLNLSKVSWIYDPDANVEDCQQVNVP